MAMDLSAIVMRRTDVPLGDLLADMRSWLDHRRIEAVGFDIANGQCEVRFKTPDDAHCFEQRFA